MRSGAPRADRAARREGARRGLHRRPPARVQGRPELGAADPEDRRAKGRSASHAWHADRAGVSEHIEPNLAPGGLVVRIRARTDDAILVDDRIGLERATEL